MKKALIAGAASVALAAMPVMGVFAADQGGPFTDTIDVTIANSCIFARGTAFDASKTVSGNAHVDGAANVAEGQAIGKWGTSTTADVLSGTLAAGEYDNDYGTSNFVVFCNNEKGWKVTAEATALTGKTTDTQNIPLGTPGANTAAWNYTSSSEDEAITGEGTYSAASQIVAQSVGTTGTAGRTFKVQYAVSVDHTLSAQTYEGTIKYTFAQLN